MPSLLRFLQLETYHGPGEKEVHGFDGPIHVSSGSYVVPRPQDDFIKAAEKVGWPELKDLQNLDANNGTQRALRYISPDGHRQDAASRYLHPRLQDSKYPNLHVLVETQVNRVLFDGKRAIGIELRQNPNFGPYTSGAQSGRNVRARKMVIVSCGACGTSTLLERSGLGRPEILKAAGVPLVADIPGVGREYEDHQLLVYGYKSSLTPEETIDAVVTGRLDTGDLIKNNDKILGWNAQDVACKLRPTEAEVAALGPQFQEAWNRDFKHNPNRPLILMSFINA